MADEREKSAKRDRASEWMERVFGAPAAIILAVILFGLVNYLSARHYHRFDWTRQRLFTLSARSQQVVHSLREPIDIYVLLGPRESQFSDVSELAQRYGAENPLLRIHAIDPDRQRDRFLELTRQLNLRVGRTAQSDVAAEAAIVMVRGDRHWEIPREGLAGLGDAPGEEGSGERVAAAQIIVERAMTEGILRVDRREATMLCFSTGHGEIPLEGGDDSMSTLSTELRHNNATTRPVDVRGTNAIPQECDALVIAGPRQAFTEADAAIVTRYLQAGGNLLMMLDPLFIERQAAPTGLEGVARLGGIDLTRTVVIEPDQAHQIPGTLPVTFIATEFGEHPITTSLRGSDTRVLVTTSRALRRAEGATTTPVSLLRTTSSAWGETETANAARQDSLARDGNDLQGPIHIAMAAQLPDIQARPTARIRDAAGRLVVIGYSHLATNEALSLGFQARFANGYLVEGALGWLAARRELVEIPGRPVSSAAISVSLQDMKHIRLYAMLLVPLAAALVGIAVWRARKAT